MALIGKYVVYINTLVPFGCVSGQVRSPRWRWRPSPRCTMTQWWRDAGTGCCSGRWWTDAVFELHCSCLGCWMHSAYGSLVHILQGAPWNQEPESRTSTEREKVSIWWVLVRRNVRNISNCLINTFALFSPSHLSPCRTNPNSISPQWSQKAGARYECTFRAWGRIWKSSDVAAA